MLHTPLVKQEILIPKLKTLTLPITQYRKAATAVMDKYRRIINSYIIGMRVADSEVIGKPVFVGAK